MCYICKINVLSFPLYIYFFNQQKCKKLKEQHQQKKNQDMPVQIGIKLTYVYQEDKYLKD